MEQFLKYKTDKELKALLDRAVAFKSVNYFKTPKDFFVFYPKFQRKQQILIILRTVLILQDKNNLNSNSKENYLISVPASYKSYKDINKGNLRLLFKYKFSKDVAAKG